MADKNAKQRKRKSFADDSNEILPESPASLENALEENACEPASKCARKSSTPEPNLKSHEENDSKCSEAANSLVTEEIEICNKDDNNVEITADAPIITITFLNEEALDKYKSKFMDFINNFAALSATDADNEIKVMEKDDISSNTGRARKRNKKSKVKKELFVVDTKPCASSGDSHKPQYNSKFKVMEETVKVEEVEVVKDRKSSLCFNCEGAHNLSQCTVPVDRKKIMLARQKFKTSKGSPSVRYHVEEGQKYDHLAPGKLTDNLRKALGLSQNELPEYIYRMRSLGYPPGWLEDAQITHSTLEIFGTKDDKMKNKETYLDADKIVNYPGFNVELEKNCKDDFHRYRCPAYSESFSKEAMIKFIKDSEVKASDNLEASDMDVDAAEDKDVPPSCESETDEIPEKRISPSLNDLESKKEELLAALDDGNSNTNSSLIKENTDDPKPELTPAISTPSLKRIVKTSSFGTPILKSLSPFARLPNPDNFSKDVSPVIDFENLPNSTGKYEQMTGVLEKIRRTLKNEQEKA